MKTIRNIAPLLVLLGGVLLLAGLLAACGSQTSGSGPAPTPTAHPAAADERELVNYAIITDVTTIQTSHRVVTMTYTSPDQPSANSSVQFEADTRAPDTVYAKGNLNGTDFERLLVGNTLHRKNASGDWEEYTESNDAYMALFLP